MSRFVTKMVNMLKGERLYASQGGPIILSQVFSIDHLQIYVPCYKSAIYIYIYIYLQTKIRFYG